jgi:hypothetical protein
MSTARGGRLAFRRLVGRGLAMAPPSESSVARIAGDEEPISDDAHVERALSPWTEFERPELGAGRGVGRVDLAVRIVGHEDVEFGAGAAMWSGLRRQKIRTCGSQHDAGAVERDAGERVAAVARRLEVQSPARTDELGCGSVRVVGGQDRREHAISPGRGCAPTRRRG